MKILMVNKFLFPKGGAETYMLELGKQLKKNNNDVQYFGMESEERCVTNGADVYVGEIDFNNVSALKKPLYAIKTVYSKEAAKKAGKVLDDFKPDVVHLNNFNYLF